MVLNAAIPLSHSPTIFEKFFSFGSRCVNLYIKASVESGRVGVAGFFVRKLLILKETHSPSNGARAWKMLGESAIWDNHTHATDTKPPPHPPQPARPPHAATISRLFAGSGVPYGATAR